MHLSWLAAKAAVNGLNRKSTLGVSSLAASMRKAHL
jgi:hypothetical protein